MKAAERKILKRADSLPFLRGTWWVDKGRLIVSCPSCGRTQGYVTDLKLTDGRVEIWCSHGKNFGPDFCDGYICTLGGLP